MAEERLIDDDKDRNGKYRIRRNADGEEELYIDNLSDDEEPEEEVAFEVPSFDTDDEEAAVMTPEQLAARERARSEEAQRKKAMLDAAAAEAQACLDAGDYDGALAAAEKAEELADEGQGGTPACLKLQALSKGLTDFSQAEACAEAAEAVRDLADEEQRQALAASLNPLTACIAAAEEETRQLGTDNEQKKEERRAVLKERLKRAQIWFAVTAVPFLALLAVTIYFSTIMHAQKDGSNIVITIVLAAVTGVVFLVALFTAHRFWESARNVSLNEKNSSTRLGREYEEKLAYLAQLRRIYAALKADDDISG